MTNPHSNPHIAPDEPGRFVAAALTTLDNLFKAFDEPAVGQSVHVLADRIVTEVWPNRKRFIVLRATGAHASQAAWTSWNVALIATGLARQMGLSRTYLNKLCIAALAHNLGHTLLPIKASLAERAQLSVAFLSAYGPVDDLVCAAILGHEEQWDGLGRPFGLAGDEIPLAARILGAAARYNHALGGGEPHRWCPSYQALEQLVQRSRAALDPELLTELIILQARENHQW